MSLTDAEREILINAGTAPDPNRRQQAVSIVLSKHGDDQATARDLLVVGYLSVTTPSFHLIPRGDAMADEDSFIHAYDHLAAATNGFIDISHATLANVLLGEPAALAPLRMILGFTHNELASAVRQLNPGSSLSGNAIKSFERKPVAPKPTDRAERRRVAIVDEMVSTILAVMNRSILDVPPAARENFHSKLDKRDTREGWNTVASDAAGVPYSALLYQRYVGGVWRQVQDAYSEVKGDNLLEIPIATLFDDNQIPYYRSSAGATGAAATQARFGITPGPDFVLPADTPSVVIESKIGEDGGTVRDKASRIKNLANAAQQRGLVACAVIDGRGWSERPSALADVVIATNGRTYTLATLPQILELPPIAALRPPPL